MSNDRKVNRFSLGPRARRVIRFVARFVNPIVLLVAGRRWMPVVGIIHHRGRRSGRDYATPIGRTCELVDPEVVDYGTARPAFPRYELLQFRLIGINECLRLRVATSPLAGEVGGRPGGGIQLANAKETHMETTLAVKPLSRNLNLALVLLALAQLMVVLDSAIVNVALPSIQHALHFNPTDLEWVINAYTITFGGLLLLGGRAGDLFGRRRMFIIGALVFTAGSLAGGFANSPTFLIIARAAQGIGGAILAPTALSILAQTFTEGKERNRAFGVYSAVSAGGGAIGLLIGGIITNYFSWRWIMFINVPIGLLIAFAAPRLLARSEGRPGRLDLPGALTVTGGSTLLVYSLSHAAIHGWSNNVTVATLAISLLLLVTFVALESRGSHPLMPLRIFANRNRSG
ncbi:MAG TPA: MFS transporter, partial [Candidatus Dormibacteraeota bacterium]|nr:MFS transporter [Candidatus Dormibacteraeota bacterium]